MATRLLCLTAVLLSTVAAAESIDNCQDCLPLPTLPAVPYGVGDTSNVVLRVWDNHHTLTLPFFIMCFLAIVFLCVVQFSLILIKKRLNMISEVTISLTESQLEEFVQNRPMKKEVFSVAMDPLRGPPSYSSIDLTDDCDKTYASLA